MAPRIWIMAAASLAAASLFTPSALHATEKGTFPRRIVSLGPINTENLFLLGAGERVVACTNYGVRPEAARHLAKIGSMLEINVEKIVSLKPDLILATGLTPPGYVKKLQDLGLRVEKFPKPASFDAICEQFIKLGVMLGLEHRARKIIWQAQSKVDEIKLKVAGLPLKKVLLQVGSEPLVISVPGSFTNDYIRLAGGVNIAADQKKGLFSLEKAVAINPDVIIIAIMGSQSGAATAEKEKWQKLKTIRAVQEKRVYTVDSNIVCSPSPMTFVTALEEIVAMIHPSLSSLFKERLSSLLLT